MTAMPYSQRRLAVARLMPSSQQIGFHGLRFALSHKRRASAVSSQRSHSSASSASRGALLHKSADGRTAPISGQTYPATFVPGMPSAVQPFRTATRTWNSAT